MGRGEAGLAASQEQPTNSFGVRGGPNVRIIRPMRANGPRFLLVGFCVLCLAPDTSRGSNGVCDSNPPTTTQQCLTAIQQNGGLVNDIFRDANGLTASQLSIFGRLYNIWPGCDPTDFAGCAGQSVTPYDCPGQYACNSGITNTFANAGTYLNALDRLWWQPCRLSNHTLVSGCPQFGPASCVADGTPGNYLPWEGLVFDLGAISNQVALFAANDHGPQPCESFEYTVYFTNNPASRDTIVNPAAPGVDMNKWNRAVLKKVYTKGYVDTRLPDPAGHAACGDSSTYAVEMDSMVSIFALPSGSRLRYAAVIAGNDGLDFPSCGYDSSEAELDAVAGLTESGAGVCASGLSGAEGATALTLAADSRTLSWTPINGASVFNVYRGAITSSWSYDQTCLAPSVSTTSLSDSTVPGSPGSAFYYLVSGRDTCDESTLGTDSSDRPVPEPFPCP